MQRSFLLSGLVLITITGRAQSFEWVWATAGGGLGDDHAVADISPTGELYLLGTYEDTAAVGGVTLISSGQTDVFIQQLDPADGSVQWTAEAHNTADMEIFDIAYRSGGELVVSGSVYHDGNDSYFGPFTIPGQAFGYQAFIAGLSPSGSWTWLSTVPGPTVQSTKGWLVEVDGNDDILLQCGIQSVYVHKFTGMGVPVWNASATSSSGSLDGYAMDVSPDGGLVITGRFYATATFGTIQLTDPTIYYDAFIARIGPSGTWEWAVQAGGSHWDKGFGVQTLSTGDIYVMGTFRNMATFGPFTCTAAGTSDLWVARLSSTGQWVWVHPAGATAYMEVYALDMSDDQSRLLCTGSYAFGATMLGSQSLPAPGTSSNDVYVAELDTSGNFISAMGFGSSQGDQGLGAAYDQNEHIYLAGVLQADMLLDTISLTNVYGNDLWVGRLDPDLATMATAPHIGETVLVPSFVGDQLMIRNPLHQKGQLLLYDALGRGSSPITVNGMDGQLIAHPAPACGLLYWRFHGNDRGTEQSGAIPGWSQQ